MSVLFIDRVAPRPYTLETLRTEGLGGTEATVLRVIKGLGAHMSVAHDHTDRVEIDFKANHIVCLRDPQTLIEARMRFPNAKLWLWCHDLAGRELGLALPLLKELAAGLICVSDYHRTQTSEVLRSFGYTGEFPIRRIYNPIDEDLKPNATEYDKNKLVWFSSPHKGLENAIQIFRNLKSFNPDFKLYVANPGYFPSAVLEEPGVVNLGALPHHSVIEHVRTALCSFLPNNIFPETFGLVFAESNAVGTPVIAHAHGAAREVLDHPSEVMDCRDVVTVIDRVMAWHSGERPIVRANPEFRTTRVVQEWLKVLK